MSEDLNRVILVGRLTRDAEIRYTNSGYALTKMGLAVNRRKKSGDQWVEEANFFDITLWGKRGEALVQYLTKGTQLAIEGQLRQERWEQDGQKRSKVSVDASNIQLLGSRSDRSGNTGGGAFSGAFGSAPSAPQPSSSMSGGGPDNDFEDDIPF